MLLFYRFIYDIMTKMMCLIKHKFLNLLTSIHLLQSSCITPNWVNRAGRIMKQPTESDFVVTYVTRDYGGAWQFRTMAERQKKQVIELSL